MKIALPKITGLVDAARKEHRFVQGHVTSPHKSITDSYIVHGRFISDEQVEKIVEALRDVYEWANYEITFHKQNPVTLNPLLEALAILWEEEK